MPNNSRRKAPRSKKSSQKRRKTSGRKTSGRRRKTSRRKTSGRRKRSLSRKASKSKITWKQFLNHKESRDVLKKTWTTKNPRKYYEKTIKQLAVKYKNL